MKDDTISLGPLTPENPPSMLDWFGQMLIRGHQHRTLPAPLLDAILPVLEYTPEQLESGGLIDEWHTAALKTYIRIHKAAEYLEPLGIYESDLCLLLQSRMKEQLKYQRRRLPKTKH
jgi:hypothetical protein